MPYIDDVSISNKITRILNNNSTDKAIRKISNIEIRHDVLFPNITKIDVKQILHIQKIDL